MANSNVPMFIQTIEAWPVQIVNADGQTLKTILTAGANGSRVYALIVTSTDTTTRDLQFVLTRSATNYILGTVNIPLNAGNINSAATINILGNAQIPGLAFDPNGNPYLDLKAGDVLAVEALTSVTAAKVVSVVGYGGDF